MLSRLEPIHHNSITWCNFCILMFNSSYFVYKQFMGVHLTHHAHRWKLITTSRLLSSLFFRLYIISCKDRSRLRLNLTDPSILRVPRRLNSDVSALHCHASTSAMPVINSLCMHQQMTVIEKRMFGFKASFNSVAIYLPPTSSCDADWAKIPHNGLVGRQQQ